MPKIYEPLDLGVFDPDLAGDTIQILRNPTRGLRIKFLPSTGDEFLAYVAEIIDMPVAGISTLLDDFDSTFFTWLFVPIMGDDGKLILPYVYELWDRYTEATVKKLRSPLALRNNGETSVAVSPSQSQTT